MEASDTACKAACEAFNRAGNKRLDYCDDGYVTRAASRCHAAKESLQSSFTEYFPHGQEKLCAHTPKSRLNCTWHYSRGETEQNSICPNRKSQNVSGWFEYSFDDDKCAEACKALGNKTNQPGDFCPGGTIYDTASSCGADPFKTITIPLDWCDGSQGTTSEQASSLCSWSITRSGGNMSDSTISGSFHESSSACFYACLKLDNHRYTPQDVCGGRAETDIQHCQEAVNSLKQAAKKWCSDAAMPAVKDALLLPASAEHTVHDALVLPAADVDALCKRAYRQDCRSKSPFKGCCGGCNRDIGSATCHWSFKSHPIYDGERCIQEGKNVSDSFHFDTQECFAACSELSKGIRLAEDLCQGSEARKIIDQCQAARESVEKATRDSTFCPQSIWALGLAEENLDSLCQQAYDNRCFENPPFSDCCALCSDGGKSYSCDWSFTENLPSHVLDGAFPVDITNRKCLDACKALGQDGNSRFDYCSEGKVNRAVGACKEANQSLSKTLPDNLCGQSNQAHFQCKWVYAYDSEATQADHWKGRIHGTFSFPLDNDDCSTACIAMGYKNNLPSTYCPGTEVYNLIQKCDPAKQSLHESIQNPGFTHLYNNYWCSNLSAKTYFTPEFSAWPTHTTTTTALGFHERQKLCINSYQGQCWKAEQSRAFNQCCKECSSALAIQRCDWEFHALDGQLQKQFDFQSHFSYPNGIECSIACGEFPDITGLSALCHFKKTTKCVPFKLNIEYEMQKQNFQCSSLDHSVILASTQPQTSVMATSVAAAFAAVGLAVALCHKQTASPIAQPLLENRRQAA